MSDAIESPPHTPTAEKLQNTTSPTPDSSIKLLPHHSASSNQVSNNLQVIKKILLLWNLTFLQLIGLVGLFEDQHGTRITIFLMMITVILQWLLVSMAIFHSIMRKQFRHLMLKNGRLQNELNSHLENKTWILVPLHPGKPLTKGEWDFDIKRESGGSIERYKAR